MTDASVPPDVALLGATGGMGSRILTELVARGIAVRALVRRPDAVEPGPGVVPVKADVENPDDLAAALQGVATLISAFNPGWQSPDLYARYRSGARTIHDAAVAAGVQRLIVIGGASSLLDTEGHEFIERGVPPEPYGSGVRAARDLLHEMRDRQQPDWVYLSPPRDCGPVGPVGRTGTYRVGLDQPVLDSEGRNALSVEDLAVAVVDELQRPQFHRQRFTVAY